LPTWIIGPALGGGPLMDCPADILKVWPEREPMRRLRPAEFNHVLDDSPGALRAGKVVSRRAGIRLHCPYDRRNRP
jgi:hypothetical protein